MLIEAATATQPWPIISGYDFDTPLNPSASVAVACLGGKIPGIVGAAIVGPLVTENIGIERIIVNCISNPNIRVLLVVGPEVKGHYAGQSLMSLYLNGLEPSHKIKGAKGAIPYLENFKKETDAAIQRFRDQVTVIDLIGMQDAEVINQEIERNNGLGPYMGQAMQLKVR